ncbi:peptide-methionine (R)-S-oxide reductase [Candidatus Peregrinibacteria bacterium CG_4_9_14_0_2_um_filter_53_11]|nr:MAG: peptide-methionine (R)-S-oxide reductase [Candidatus Peregrinibacteria bacterium CG_4_9_14_0_2_um_filter_53_11]
MKDDMTNKPESYWKEKLTPEQYHILREQGTESPYKNEYYLNKAEGMYTCGACEHPLFSSDTKFESGSGWPSFYDPVNRENVELIEDNAHGMSRTEVRCKNCGSHLGHVFNDGPTPTGQRYCINSCSLKFKAKEN